MKSYINYKISIKNFKSSKNNLSIGLIYIYHGLDIINNSKKSKKNQMKFKILSSMVKQFMYKKMK